MTAINPIPGAVPPLPAVAPAPSEPMSLQQVLAGGVNLGGTGSSPDYGIGALPESTPGATTPVTGGGGQAVQGAANVSQEQLAAALQQLLTALNLLITAVKAQQAAGGGVTGGGGVGSCGMPGCTMDHGTAMQGVEEMQGASGAPSAAAGMAAHDGHGSHAHGADAAPHGATGDHHAAGQPRKGKKSKGTKQQHAHEHGATASQPAAQPSSTAPVQVPKGGSAKDKTSTAGLTAASLRGLEEAHRFNLPLVSGKRSGGGSSDHDHGDAIDVADIPIGAAGSTEGSPTMKKFAEHMRQQGKAGKLSVKYVIADGRIASARDGWNWRPYTYPGKSAAQLAALKSSNRGEYNRIQHYDHVHVSFN